MLSDFEVPALLKHNRVNDFSLSARQYPLLVLLYLIASFDAGGRSGYLVAFANRPVDSSVRLGAYDRSILSVWRGTAAYSWLFEIIVYGLYSHLGLFGLVLYTVIGALAITTAVHLLVRRAQLPFAAEIALTAIGVFCLKPPLTPRPWLFSIVFFIRLLHTLLAAHTSGNLRSLYLLPVIFLFWANLHIQFIYGLALVLLFAAEPLFHKLLSSWLTTDPQLLGVSPAKPQSAPREDFNRRDHEEYLSGGTRLTKRPFGFLVQPGRDDAQLRLVLLAILCMGATLINPYHLMLYKPVFEYALQTRVFQNIQEFHPMFFRQPQDWLVLSLALGTAFVLGWRRETRLFPYLMLIMGAFLAFRARRDTWVLVVGSLAIIVEQQLKANFASGLRFNARKLLFIAAGVLVSLFAIGYYRNISEQTLTSHVATRFPTDAVSFVRNNQEQGPLYNHLDWGGYLIWALPEIAVSMDGRTNLHGEERIELSLATWSGHPGWHLDPELGRSRLIIAGVYRPLTSLLRSDSRFRLVYSDHVAAVFVANEK